jgi:hypothetical protein
MNPVISLCARRIAAGFLVLAAAVVLGGCVAYEPVPGYGAASPFDRSWSAALGALQDQGVVINEQNRAWGVIRGTRGPIAVNAFVTTRADGRVQVEFSTSSTTDSDPALFERITASYNQRMGR